MTALIDGDSIIYILAWHHRESTDIEEMNRAVDKFLEDIFTMVGADMYYGALACDDKCFRYNLYKVKPYKGTRNDPAEHVQFWKPIILQRLKEKWKFENADGLEADDLINMAALNLPDNERVICSVDKDLKQIIGRHYDYRTGEFVDVDGPQAAYNFWMLMLTGDDTDNIAGIPGVGEKKAKEKLAPMLAQRADWTQYHTTVEEMYIRHFCPHYSSIIFAETLQTLALVWDPTREIQLHPVPKEPHPFELLSGN